MNASINHRLESLEQRASAAEHGTRCPGCGRIVTAVDQDHADGPTHCFQCGAVVVLKPGTIIKGYIGVRGCDL